MIIHVEIGMAELEKTADGALGLAGGDVLGVIGIGHEAQVGARNAMRLRLEPLRRVTKKGM